jgi:thiamine biosynthesis lipoprotein
MPASRGARPVALASAGLIVPPMNRVLIPLDLLSVPAGDESRAAQVQSLHGETMGTTWTVKLAASPAHDLARLRAAIQQELDRVVSQMSTWSGESDLSRFNRAPAGSWHDLPDELFTVLQCAQAIARDSGGAYDPTVGPLVNLWGFGPESRRSAPPSADAIRAARARSGWRRLDLDAAHRRARQPGDLYVDLSSIAKGFGVDQVANRLRAEGVDSYLVEVGGELRGFGVKPDEQPWWVSLEHPAAANHPAANVASNSASGIAANIGANVATNISTDIIVALHGLSVATSGDYRRYFEDDGVRYSHTIDLRTGAPVVHRLASVTVLHADCMSADAQSTALTVLGVDEGYDYACRYGLAALFITRPASGAAAGSDGFDERMTPAFAAMLDA